MAGADMDDAWEEEFIKYHDAIQKARGQAQKRLQHFVDIRDAHAFKLFKAAFWKWVRLVKDMRPISKEYNNERMRELKIFVRRLRSKMDKKSEQLSTWFLATELQDLDLQKMGEHFAEMRQWLHFAEEVEQVFQSWVFEESMELFQEWTGSASTL